MVLTLSVFRRVNSGNDAVCFMGLPLCLWTGLQFPLSAFFPSSPRVLAFAFSEAQVPPCAVYSQVQRGR